ncbi:MAG TPA: YIP1 family protein [Anaerolineales bacterium]|nr:YIP1 family protein [Anaerolineales bacterium]
MVENIAASVEPPRRFHFDWVSAVLFKPKQAFARITEQLNGVWLTPLLIQTVTAVVLVLVLGYVSQTYGAGTTGEMPQIPEYYTPEQIAQIQQAMAGLQSPVFIYFFPTLIALGKVWLGWLLVGGIIHLVSTMLGGRGNTTRAMNIVAWAGLPFAVRDIVRVLGALIGRKALVSPGLAGFAPTNGSNLALFLAAFLALVDIYVIWHLILIVIGLRASNGLPLGKAFLAATLTIVLLLVVQGLVAYFTSSLGGLTIIRPFF